MSIKDKLPLLKSDPSIKYGDTGDAVKKIQDFLQSLSSVSKKQDLEASVSGKTVIRLTDGKIYGKLESNTHNELQVWQKENKESIKKAGQLSDEDFSKTEYGSVSFATWAVMSGKVSAPAAPTQSSDTSNTATSPPASSAAPTTIKDPAEATGIKEATHFVKTVNTTHRLALREAPAYVAVGKEATEDVDKKGKLVIMMPNDTVLKMVDPWLGYQCQWHQVEVVDSDALFANIKILQKTKKLYCFAEFVQPLSTAKEMLPIRCMDCNERNHLDARRSIPFPEWVLLDECEPFFDEFTCSYYIAITLADQKSDNTLVISQKKTALERGIDNLLSYYNKQRASNDIKRYTNAFEFGEVAEVYLDERPDSYVKMLVKIPAKYFDAIPEVTDNLDYIPTLENGQLPKDFRTATIASNKLSTWINLVADEMESYADKVDEWTGEIENYDFKTESDKLRSIPPMFATFLGANGYSLNTKEEDLFEFGFEGPCFNLLYVLINQGDYSVPLRVGFECFVEKDPISSARIMGYVFYLESIVEEVEKKKLSWMSFIKKYVCPIPKINPSKKPVKKPVQKEVKRVLKQTEDKPVKTPEELDSETELIGSPPFQDRIYQARKLVSEYTGDSLFACDKIPGILDRIQTVEDLYTQVLNKVTIKDATAFIVQCLAARFLPPDLAFLACKAVLGTIPLDKLQKLLDVLPSDKVMELTSKMAIFQEPPINGKIGSDVEKIKDTIKEVISKEELCRLLADLDPFLVSDFIADFIIDIPNFDFEPPVITIPDDFPIEDLLEQIGNLIVETVKRILTQVLMALIKEIFESICELCKPVQIPPQPEVYGGENLNDMLGDSRGIVDKAKNDFGLGSDFDANAFRNFLDDLSNILLPSELCSLLNGMPANYVLTLVLNLIKTKYPMFLKTLGSASSIKEFFVYLGSFMDPKVCEEIGSRFKDSDDDLCPSKENDNFKKNLLANKLSSDQVKEQLENVRKKNEEKFEKFLSLGVGDFAQKLIPPILADPCKERISGKVGLIKDPPTVDFLNRRVVDTMFDGVHDTFNTDVLGFSSSLLEDRRANDKSKFDVTTAASYKTAYDAVRKTFADLNKDKSDSAAILADPDLSGGGLGKRLSVVASGVKQSLENTQNFYKKEKDITDSKANYVFKASMTAEEKNLADFKKDNSVTVATTSSTKGNVSSIAGIGAKQSVVSTIGGTGVGGAKNAIQDIEECEEAEKSLGVASLIDDYFEFIISKDTIIEYALPVFKNTNGLKDKFFVVVNDPTAFVVEGEEKLSSKTESFIKKMNVKYTGEVSLQQELFASYVSNLWGKNVAITDKNKIAQKTKFYKFFRDEAFHRIYDQFIEWMSLQASKSSAFNTEKFLALKFLPAVSGKTGAQVCPPTSEVSLLDVEETKEKVLKNYEKIAATCSDSKASPIERSSQDGATEMLLRVFVIEYVLRALFVFAEFNTSDILGDKAIIDYLLQKIKKSLANFGSKFFDSVALNSKDYLERRGDKFISLTDDTSNPEGTVDEKLSDPLQPDTISGVAALEYLLKEQIAAVSDIVETIFGTQSKNINNRFLNEWITTQDVSNDVSKDNYFGSVFVIGKAIKPGFALNKTGVAFKEGKLILEKYMRVTSQDGTAADFVEPIADFKKYIANEFIKGSGQCARFGLRLVYVPPLADNNHFTSIMVSDKIQMMPGTAKKEKAFELDNRMAFPIPLVEIESDEILNSVDDFAFDEKKMIEKMKKILVETEEYKFLFSFIFPFQRLLSLTMIYNSQLMPKYVKNIEVVFNRTKRTLKALLDMLSLDGEWWNKSDDLLADLGNNAKLRQERMESITVDGPSPDLLSIAAMTIPIIIKGMASKHDESYKLIKNLGLKEDLSSIPKVAPINVFGPFGFGPPITQWGILALGTPELSGEKKERLAKEKDEAADKEIGQDSECPEEKK